MSKSAIILSTNPYTNGGVSTFVLTTRQLLIQNNIDTQIIYTIPESIGNDKLDPEVFANVEKKIGNNATAIGRIPIPFAWTISPLFFAYNKIKQADIRLCVCGSANAAFPLALAGKPYSLWIATLWEDELLAQKESGSDSYHANKLLNHPLYSLLKWQERYCLTHAKVIITISYYTAERIRTYLPEVSSKVKTVIIPIDTNKFHPRNDDSPPPLFDNYLLFVARINDPRKNIKLLIDAFAEVHKVHPNLNLVLGGDEPNPEFIDYVENLNLTQHVFFPGFLTDEKLLALYQNAKLFVMSSNQEGLGLVLLESLACGTPVVSTHCGGPDNFVTEEVGRLVSTHSINELSEAILELLQDEEQLKKRGQRGITYVHDNFSLEAQQDKLMNLLL